MFEQYKSRMAQRGNNMSEMLRMQSNMVIEETWNRDPNARQVYVVKVNRGLPEVTEEHELIDVKFNVDTYQNSTSDEPAYHLQFRHGAEKRNVDIGVGSYVYMRDEDGEWKWWMLVGFDERPQFRQYHVMECNWKFGWVVDNKIYYHLGVLRNGSVNREADENSYTSVVNGNCIVWMTTNADTQTIGHGQRFLISDVGRMPPLCYEVASISDTRPIGLTKFVMSQSTYDSLHDNAELMLANYYQGSIEPEESKAEAETPDVATSGIATLTYNGTKPTVKVGGSYKVFTASFSDENVAVDKWIIRDENGDITADISNYTIEYDGNQMKLKVAPNYELIKKVLTIQVIGTDRSATDVSVEVIG